MNGGTADSHFERGVRNLARYFLIYTGKLRNNMERIGIQVAEFQECVVGRFATLAIKGNMIKGSFPKFHI